MANNVLNTRIVLCNDTSVTWASSDKVLLKGEMAIEFPESGAPKFKFGDGTNTFANLPYSAMTPDEVSAAIKSAVDTVTVVTSTTVSNWGFKKTDTWRGVQNNLTSTATDQSLSAYQGKVLKDLVDKKTTFTYSSTQPTSSASNAVWIG